MQQEPWVRQVIDNLSVISEIAHELETEEATREIGGSIRSHANAIARTIAARPSAPVPQSRAEKGSAA